MSDPETANSEAEQARAFETATRALEVFARLGETLMALPHSARRLAIEAAVEDPEVRSEVMRLASLSGLTPPEAEAPSMPVDELEPGALLGQRYRIIRQIGEGGVGRVYLANQESPVKRQVAIKVLPGELAGPRAELRFESERNALSRMNHPWVASIFDAGRTRAGRLFVVMEYVDGLPVDTYCARHALSVWERAELFVKICRGVHHVHQKGIIHRDLKPGNVLVAQREGIAVPKIIDFGIAKISSRSDAPRATVAGFFVGTPEYMSPEQAGVGDGDVDTISDVYSLGVLFYELLTGLLPRTRESDAIQITDWQRALATIDPVRPSQRLFHALQRGEVEPGPVSPRELVGDLDSIVMKALARERERRYSSASELAADVERYLNQEPIVARPPSLGYRLLRAMRRHPAMVAAAAAVLVSGIVATTVILSVAAEREHERTLAEAAQLRAEHERELARQQAELAAEMTARSLLASARVALEVRDAASAKRALDAIEEDFRGWEWRWLRHEADRSTATSPHPRHFGAVRKLSVLGADAAVVSGGDDGQMRVWSAADLTPIYSRQAHADPVTGLAVGEHPVTSIAATTDGVRSLVVWDLATGSPLWSLDGPSRLSRESLSLDGQRLAVAREAKTLEIYEPLTGALLERVRVDEPRVELAGFLVDDLLFYDVGNFTVLLGRDKGRHEVLPGRWPFSSPTRDRLVLKPWNRWHDRRVFDVRSGVELGWVRGDDTVKTLHLAPDDGVVTSEQPTTVTVRARLDRNWRALTESSLVERIRVEHGPVGAESARREGVVLPGHRDIVTAIVHANVEGAFFSSDGVGAIKRWETSLMRSPFTVAASNDAVFGADFDPGGERVATTGWGAVKLWDTRTGRELWSRWWTRSYITGVAFSSDGARVVAVDWRGEAAVFDAEDGALLTRWPSVGATVTEVIWPAGAAYFATRGGEVMRVDPGTGEVLWRHAVHPETPIVSMVKTSATAAFPDILFVGGAIEDVLPEHTGDELKRPSNHPFVRALDARTGREAMVLEPAIGPFSALALSPDERELAAGAEDGTVAVWSLASRRLRLRLPGVGGRIVAITWTPDAKRIVFAHQTGVVVVADARTLAPLVTVPGAPPGVRALVASRDGKALLMSGQGAPLVAHEATPRGSSEARTREASVRAELDAMLGFLPGAEAVVATTTSAEVAALARARGDNPNQLNSYAWAAVRYPGEPKAALAFARAQSEVAAGGWPIWQFENTRALARLRDGDLEGALVAVERSVALQQEVGLSTHPTDWATAAMALAKLGRQDEARAMLRRALAEAELEPWRGDGEVAALVTEAEALLTGLGIGQNPSD